jgi:SAM-dependent methyltransferase
MDKICPLLALCMNYYDKNFHSFVETTLKLDMSDLYEPFERYLAPGGQILDLGCGAGRDSKYFRDKYHVVGLEPNQKLAQFAQSYAQAPVIQESFENFVTDQLFDGIWACASLLHFKSEHLPKIFQRVCDLLKFRGVVYVSFKYGNDEAIVDGRHFTNCNEESLTKYIKDSSLTIESMWISIDKREKRQHEQWLNAILMKSKGGHQ